MHLAAFNNSDKCVEVLIQAVLSQKVLISESKSNNTISDNSGYDLLTAINRRSLLKEWVNLPT